MQIQPQSAAVLPVSPTGIPANRASSLNTRSSQLPAQTHSLSATSRLSSTDQLHLQKTADSSPCPPLSGAKTTGNCGKTNPTRKLTKILGGAGLIGGGAAVGFLVGGPIGAVIGAIIGAILMALTLLGKSLGSLIKEDKSKSTLPESPCTAKKSPIPAARTALIAKELSSEKNRMPGQKEREERRLKYI